MTDEGDGDGNVLEFRDRRAGPRRTEIRRETDSTGLDGMTEAHIRDRLSRLEKQMDALSERVLDTAGANRVRWGVLVAVVGVVSTIAAGVSVAVLRGVLP